MAMFAVIISLSIASLAKLGTGNDLPHFVGAPSHYKVYENAVIGTIVGNITAKDSASSEVLTLSLDSIGNELFDIVDSSGTKSTSGNSPLKRSLRLKKLLDREAREDYNFVITVQDNTQGDRKIPETIGLILLDVNDNQPIFQGTPYTAKLEENTPSNSLYQVSATDADLGSAKSILYRFAEDCKTADCEPFLISSTTGIVSLNTSITLDYETRNRYNLHIIAKDRGTPPLNSSTTLVVEVLDLSDRPPEFEKSSYRADIEENMAVGSSVVETRAFDGDRGVNNPVTYAIVGGDDSHFFKIDNSTGLITINSTIDRDNGNDFFELIVQATESTSNETGNTTVFVTIKDVNDNKPTFPPAGSYTTTIPEDTPIGTPVFFQMGAVDNDREAKNARFKYSISGDPQHFFTIDPDIGRIELNKTLDFERETQFTFLVIAREISSVEKFSANQTITVNVSNVNDNDPKFNESQYNFNVSESVGPGTVLGTITATDDDSEKFGEITYSLSGDGAEKFSVASVNGTVSVEGSLDYESRETYDLTLEAKDGGNRITRVPVKIFVNDSNDNTPVFEVSPTSANLDENKNSGTLRVTVTAKDKDSGINAMIRYSIVGGDPSNNFTIDPDSGVITNVGPLDYETKTEFTLTIMAKDQGTPPRNSTRTLPITINDQNDNAPYFNETSFKVDLMENTDIDYPIVQLYAFDEDSAKNAELVYSIVSGNDEKKFTINADGLLLTRSSPDREKSSEYTLNVSVSDSGTPKKYAYAQVVVNITDENDESPKFNITVDKKSLEEGSGTVNATVAKNTASDGDAGPNGTIEYMIADGNSEGKFRIDRDTGEVTVASELDFETVRIYSLKIVASDKGTPPRSGEYQLVVEVTDINDNDPVFGQPKYSFAVLENSPNGTSIVDLRADDKDDGKNKLITYSIVYGNEGSAFVINNATGKISTQADLDREAIPQYLLIVKAKDHGDPSREGTTNITITVLDENDEKPQFNSLMYYVSIPENTPKGSSVFVLSAVDGDDGPAGQVIYLMHDSGNLENGNNVFSIGSKSGEVKTAISLDFEIHRTFTLTITASDNGAPSLSSNATLVVTITDVDDNPPVFTKNSWSADVNENAKEGTVIAQLNATDVDFESAHRTIYYKIDSGNDDGVFGIWPDNGTVYVANSTKLDRETTSIYELNIKAETLNEFKNVTVQETTTKLTIKVEDYNDYAPVFREPSYSKKIPESFELNEVVVTVTADDEDIGTNKKISYSITSGNDAGIFAIDNTTGVVTIVKKLDRETTDFHKLIVTAKDHGNPSLESNVSVTITVKDTNDKRPTLILPGSSFTILENATIGTVVAQFNATDEDLDKNADVGYRIVSGNADGVFGIDNKTGLLTTVQLLDYEKVQKYQIGVQAYDYGSPSLQSDIEVITINIKDVNDNPPSFKSQKTATLNVFENENSGAFVGTVKATDDDKTDPLYYYIRGGDGENFFAVNDSTGVVTTTAKLDREKTDAYFIYVEVFNSKKTPQEIQSLGTLNTSGVSNTVPATPAEDNIQLVKIKVEDKNDNPPYFKHSFYKAGVSENAEYQSRIKQITCLDNDIGNNSRLVYKLVDLQPAELLSVESDTGWILAGQQQYFANGVGKTYSFTYSCSDPSSTALTNVTIFVLVDDQRVRFTLGINDTEFVRNNIDEIKKALDDATGLEFNVDSIQYHLQSNGKYDLSKTDIFMHAVDPKTNKVVDKDTVLKLIDTNYGKLIEIFQKYKVNAVEPKKPDDEGEGFDVVLAAAIALGVILFIILLCFFCVICLMRRSHNRKLRAAKAIGSQEQSYGLATPGTNLHVFEGSNPIWMDPYDNWKTDDDKNSNTAKLYEAQTITEELEEEEENEDDKKNQLPTNGITNPIHNNVKPTDLNASGNSNLSDDVFM